MSTDIARDVIIDRQEELAAEQVKLGNAYQAVFDGTPTPDDQALVKDDLEFFCGMRTGLYRGDTGDTAHAAGMFRVYQRIHAFRFPRHARPADANRSTGGTNDQGQEGGQAGRGIAEPTAE